MRETRLDPEAHWRMTESGHNRSFDAMLETGELTPYLQYQSSLALWIMIVHWMWYFFGM